VCKGSFNCASSEREKERKRERESVCEYVCKVVDMGSGASCLLSISSTFYARILRQYFGAKNYKAET